MHATFAVYASGTIALGFALFHLFFHRLFGWEQQLPLLSRINRGIFLIFNNRLIYFFLMTAALCFSFPEEMHHSPLGRAFLTGLAGFWAGRFLEQFIYLKINDLRNHLLTFIFAIAAVTAIIPFLFGVK